MWGCLNGKCVLQTEMGEVINQIQWSNFLITKWVSNNFNIITATLNSEFRHSCKSYEGNLSVIHRLFKRKVRVMCSGYPCLVLRHLECEQGGQKGLNAHPIDGTWPSKFQKRGGINQGKAPSKGCVYKLAHQRHLVLVDRIGLMSALQCMTLQGVARTSWTLRLSLSPIWHGRPDMMMGS